MKGYGNYISDTAYEEISELIEPDIKYYHIKIENKIKREVNRFKLRNFLNEKCKQQVE